MSHNSYIRPAGVWFPNSIVTHGEFAALDAAQFAAISEAGGSWASVTPIVIGGAGVTMHFVGANDSSGSSSFTFNGPIAANAAVLFSNDTRFNNGSTTEFQSGSITHFLNGSVVYADDGSLLHLNGVIQAGSTSYMDLGGQVIFSGTALAATGFTTNGIIVNGTSTLNGGMTVTGTAIHLGELDIRADSLLRGALALTGAGQIAWRVVAGATSNHTYSVSTVDEVVVDSSFAGAITFNVDHAGAVDGSRMRFSFIGAPNNGSVYVIIGDAATTAVLFVMCGAVPASTTYQCTWCELVFLSGAWRRSAFGRA